MLGAITYDKFRKFQFYTLFWIVVESDIKIVIIAGGKSKNKKQKQKSIQKTFGAKTFPIYISFFELSSVCKVSLIPDKHFLTKITNKRN